MNKDKYTCKKCGSTKFREEFYNNPSTKLGIHTTCKPCIRERNRKSKPEHYIYVISHPKFDGWVKIGRTKDVSKRLNSYNTGCPFRAYEVNYSKFIGNPVFIENHFKENVPSNGYEWFNISVEDAIKIINNWQ